MDAFSLVLGEVLANARKAAGLSQEELAYRCKLHPTYISQLERGHKSPTVRSLLTIAGAVGVSGSHLLGQAEQLVMVRQEPPSPASE